MHTRCDLEKMAKVIWLNSMEVPGPLDTPCETWTRPLLPDGYGQLKAPMTDKVMKAHKAAWLVAYGELPEHRLEHLCGRKHCVNVAHMRETDKPLPKFYGDRIYKGTLADHAERFAEILVEREAPYGLEKPCLMHPVGIEHDHRPAVFCLGRKTPATHLAWRLAKGRWPRKQINHHCDNPPCCEATHLYDGTHKQNMVDALVRERSARTSNADIIGIKKLKRRFPDMSHERIARRYLVHKGTVGKVLRGELDKYLPPELLQAV